MKIPNKNPKCMIFHNFWAKIDSFPLEGQDLAHIKTEILIIEKLFWKH